MHGIQIKTEDSNFEPFTKDLLVNQVGIPLILTFKLDAFSQDRLDNWRQQYFPPARNHLKAHLTIYHQLPGQNIKEISKTLQAFVLTHSAIALRFSHLITRAGFVGVAIESPELIEARAKLSRLFGSTLRAQDKQPYRPHVTITNLGSPKEAEKCMADLEPVFSNWNARAEGLELFHYRNGPWDFAEHFPFADPIL